MAENLTLVRQAVETIKNEVEDGANTATRVGGAMSDILEYGVEQTDKITERLDNTCTVLGVYDSLKALKEALDGMNTIASVGRYVGRIEFQGLYRFPFMLTVSVWGGYYVFQALTINVTLKSMNWSAAESNTAPESGGENMYVRRYNKSAWEAWRDLGSQLAEYTGTTTGAFGSKSEAFLKEKYFDKKVESGGILNLSTATATELSSIMSGLSDVGIKLYLVSDSAGNLPSLSGETAITVTDTAKKLLFGKTDDFGVSVGDILAVTKLTCRIIPLNDAKISSGDFPGADGLMTVWDKAQVNTIRGVTDMAMRASSTANAALPKADLLPSRWAANMDEALEQGVYPWCTLGRPSGSTGAYTLIVLRTSTNDGSYDTIEQTAYGREGELGQIWKRIIFMKSDGTDTQFGEWREVTQRYFADPNTESASAAEGAMAISYYSPYFASAAELAAQPVSYRCDATYDDVPNEAPTVEAGVIAMWYNSNTQASYVLKADEALDGTWSGTIGLYTLTGGLLTYLYTGGVKLGERTVNDTIAYINAPVEFTTDTNFEALFKIFPKLVKAVGGEEKCDVKIKGQYGWASLMEQVEKLVTEKINELNG